MATRVWFNKIIIVILIKGEFGVSLINIPCLNTEIEFPIHSICLFDINFSNNNTVSKL